MSLFTIFPRDNGEDGHGFFLNTTQAPPEVAPEDVDVDTVTASDLSYIYDDYHNVDNYYWCYNYNYNQL